MTCSVAYGEIDFTYATDRTDDVATLRLSNITLRAYNPYTQSNSTTVRTYTLVQTYTGSPATDPNVSRLQFNYIYVTGNTIATSQQQLAIAQCFYSSTLLPSRQSNSFDFWGYYSQPPILTSPLFVAQTRPPDPTLSQAGVLTTVKELSGSQWELTYELNDYNNSGVTAQIGGLRVKKIAHTLPTGESLYTTYSYTDSTGLSSGAIVAPYFPYLGFPCNSGAGKLTFSEAPALANDVNGNFVGYGYVKVTNQNGGYTISNFTNPNTFPDLFTAYYNNGPVPLMVPSTSFSYKRGLLLKKTVFNSAGVLLTKTVNTYTTQNPSIGQSAFGYHSTYYVVAIGSHAPCTMPFSYTVYYSPFENYQLSQTDQYDYDQTTPSQYTHKTTTYTYSTYNHHLITNFSTTDSKQQSFATLVYYPDNLNTTPMIVGNEYNVINGLNTSNILNPIIHTVTTRNGAQIQVHNTYASFSNGSVNNTYLSTVSKYVGSQLQTQVSNNYDPNTSNLVSFSTLGGKSTSIQYGYNNCYPVAKIENASSNVTVSQQSTPTSSYFNFPSGSQAFTISGVGSITVTIGFGSYPGATNITTASYSITGPSNSSGNLCYTATGSGCGSSASVTINNLPAGNYTLTGSGSTNYPSSNPNLSFTYTSTIPVTTYNNEFFYEGFEENPQALGISGAHTGIRYFNGTYIPPFIPPNSRSYIIQYWSLNAGKWVFSQQAYSHGMSLTGQFDDIRIFPVDALMTTYTYNPVIGKTSEIDPSGKTLTYEYDGLQRLNLVRDQDGFIQTKNCYNYYNSLDACPLSSIVNSTENLSATTWNIVLTNILSGQTYSYPVANVTNPTNSITVPTGNYNLTMTPGNSVKHYVGFDGYYMSGTSAASFSLTNIAITNNVSFDISNGQ